MNQEYELPKWLDSFIFETLHARYERKMNNFDVINMTMRELLGYLGTYFPRSYAESCGIFEDIFCNEIFLEDKKEISIFDFGCGSGADLFGLLSTLNEFYSSLHTVNIVVCDGSKNQLFLLKKILAESKKYFGFTINYNEIPFTIKSEHDVHVLSRILKQRYRDFDIALTFKSLCEFMNRGVLDSKNIYTFFTEFFMEHIKYDGICLIEDMTYKVEKNGVWLGSKLQEAALMYSDNIVSYNEDYNFTFHVSHSRKRDDLSKVAWRAFARESVI